LGTGADGHVHGHVGGRDEGHICAFGVGALLVIRGGVAMLRSVSGAPADEGERTAPPLRAIGFLLFGAAYILLLPYVGYLAAIALLLAGIAIYEGAARDWKVPAVALGGALFFWAVFVKLLGVQQPPGVFWNLF
jgi:cell division protein FtsW (lipid II flippase)